MIEELIKDVVKFCGLGVGLEKVSLAWRVLTALPEGWMAKQLGRQRVKELAMSAEGWALCCELRLVKKCF